jgi:hypothetical protein
MTFQNQNSNSPVGGGGGFLKFSQGALLTPSAGSITPTDTHHHVAAGAISVIATTYLDTNEQQFLLLTADGTVTFTAGASLVVNTLSLAIGQSMLLILDGGTIWREVESIGAGGAAGATQTANRVFAGPATGAAAAPTFRALVTADLPDNGVTDAKLRDSVAISVIGRSANSTGDPADISAAAASAAVLRESGSVLGFGTVATAGVADNAITDAKLRDASALSVIGRSANSTGDPADIAAASDGQVLRRSGTALGFGAVSLATAAAVTGVLPVGNGGTGADLSATGGTSRVLQQASAGAAVTVAQLASSALSDSANVPLLNANNAWTGVQTAANQPRAYAYNSANQSIANATETALTFDTEVYDVGAVHSTSSNTSRFTVPTGGGGLYIAIGQIEFASNVTGQRQMRIRANGGASAYSGWVVVQAVTTGGAATKFQTMTILALAAADYVEFMVYQDSGGALNATGANMYNSFGILAKLW